MRTEIHHKLDEMLSLEEGWDGYGGLPVCRDAIARLRYLLVLLVNHDTPTPDIIPAADGGVTAEWYSEDMKLSVSASKVSGFHCIDFSDGVCNKLAAWRFDFPDNGPDDRLRELVARLPKRE